MFVNQMLYLVNIAIIKISILIMYYRFFPIPSFRKAAWILSTFTVLWAISSLFLYIFQCKPIARTWNQSVPGKCLGVKETSLGIAIPNIVTHVVILVMPMNHVRRLQLQRIQQIAVTLIFLLGGL